MSLQSPTNNTTGGDAPFSYASRMGYGGQSSSFGGGSVNKAQHQQMGGGFRGGGGGMSMSHNHQHSMMGNSIATIPRHTPSSANLRRAVVRILPGRTTRDGQLAPEAASGSMGGPLSSGNASSRLLRDGAIDPLQGRSNFLANQLPTGLCDIWHPTVTNPPMQAGELAAMATAQGCGLYVVDCGYNTKVDAAASDDLLSHYVRPFRRGVFGQQSSSGVLSNSSRVYPGKRLGEQSASELSGELAMLSPVTTAEVMQGNHGVLPILLEKLLTDFKQPVSLSFFAFTIAERPVTDLLAPLIPITASERPRGGPDAPASSSDPHQNNNGTLTSVNVPSVSGFLRLYSTVTGTHSFRDARSRLSFGFILRVGKVMHVILLIKAEHQTDAIGILEGTTEHLSEAARQAIQLDELMSGVAVHGASARHPALSSSLMATLATNGSRDGGAIAQSALQHQFGSSSNIQDLTVGNECSALLGGQDSNKFSFGIPHTPAKNNNSVSVRFDDNAWAPKTHAGQTYAINQNTVAERAASRARKLLCANVLSQIRRTMAVLHVKRQAVDYFKPMYVVRLHADQGSDELGMIPFLVGRCRSSADASPAYLEYCNMADGSTVGSQVILPNRRGPNEASGDYGNLQTSADPNFVAFSNMEAYHRQQQASRMSQAAMDLLRQQPNGFVPGPGSLFGPYAATAPLNGSHANIGISNQSMYSPRRDAAGSLPVPPDVVSAWSPTSNGAGRFQRVASPSFDDDWRQPSPSRTTTPGRTGTFPPTRPPPNQHLNQSVSRSISHAPDFTDEATPRYSSRDARGNLIPTASSSTPRGVTSSSSGPPRFRTPTNTQATTSGMLSPINDSNHNISPRYYSAGDGGGPPLETSLQQQQQSPRSTTTRNPPSTTIEAAKPLLSHHLEHPSDTKSLQDTLMYLKKEEVVCHTAHRELEKDYLHVLDAVEGIANRNVGSRAALKRVGVQNAQLQEEVESVTKRAEQLQEVKGSLDHSTTVLEGNLAEIKSKRDATREIGRMGALPGGEGSSQMALDEQLRIAQKQHQSRKGELEEGHRRIVRKIHGEGREARQTIEADINRLKLDVPNVEGRIRREATVIGGELEVIKEHIATRQQEVQKFGQQAEEYRSRKVDLERQLVDIRSISGDVSSEEGRLQILKRDNEASRSEIRDAERELAALDAPSGSQHDRIASLQKQVSEARAICNASVEKIAGRADLLRKERRRLLEHSELLERMKLQTAAFVATTDIAAKHDQLLEPLMCAAGFDRSKASVITELETKLLDADIEFAQATKRNEDKTHQLKHLKFRLVQLDSSNRASENDPDLCKLEEQCRAELDEIARYRKSQHDFFRQAEEDLQRSRRVYLTLFLELVEQINSELEAHEGDKPYFSGRPLRQSRKDDSESDNEHHTMGGSRSGSAASTQHTARPARTTGGFAAPTASSSRRVAAGASSSTTTRMSRSASKTDNEGDYDGGAVVATSSGASLFANRVNMKPTSAFANKAMKAINNTHIRKGLTSAGIDGQASQSVEVGSKVCAMYLEWKSTMNQIKALSSEEATIMSEVSRQEEAADRTAGRIARRRQDLSKLDVDEQQVADACEHMRRRLESLRHAQIEHRKGLSEGAFRDVAHKRDLMHAIVLEVEECESSIQLLTQHSDIRKAELNKLWLMREELLESLQGVDLSALRDKLHRGRVEQSRPAHLVVDGAADAAARSSSSISAAPPAPAADVPPNLHSNISPTPAYKNGAMPPSLSTFGSRLFGSDAHHGINDSTYFNNSDSNPSNTSGVGGGPSSPRSHQHLLRSLGGSGHPSSSSSRHANPHADVASNPNSSHQASHASSPLRSPAMDRYRQVRMALREQLDSVTSAHPR